MKKFLQRKDPKGRGGLADRLSLPTGVLGTVTFLSLRGRECLELQGCLELLCYEEDCVILRTYDGILQIRGKDLTLRTYHRACITVGGFFSSLSFDEEKGAPDASHH